MHRPAVFQVADHHDIDIFERTLRFLDRIKVEQRLTRMLVGPVSGIDHRHARNLAGIAGRTFDRMTHHDHIAVVRDRHDRIVESFAFRNAGIRSPRKTDHPAPRRLIALSKLSRVRVDGSKKQRREYLPASTCRCGSASKRAARSIIFRISSHEKSVIETRLFFPIELYFYFKSMLILSTFRNRSSNCCDRLRRIESVIVHALSNCWPSTSGCIS